MRRYMFSSPNNTAYNSIVCIDKQQTKVPLVICFAYSRANAINFLYQDVSSDKWNRRFMHYAKQFYSILLCPNIPLRYYKVICSLWDRWDLSILNLCFDFVYFKRHFKNDTKSGCVVTLIQITFSYWQQSYRVCLINATNGYIQEMPMIPIWNIKMGIFFYLISASSPWFFVIYSCDDQWFWYSIFFCSYPEQSVYQTVDLPAIWKMLPLGRNSIPYDTDNRFDNLFVRWLMCGK